MANAGNASGATPIAGPAPDISKMSAKERFSRLNDRVMQAMERGDTTFVLNFTPMALGAYSQLDSVSADERYHAAMIHAQIGEFKEALALADTILANHPNHLFGYLVRATVSEFQGDSARARESRARFLAAYDAELKRELPEYIDHKPILEGFRASAMTQLPAGQR